MSENLKKIQDENGAVIVEAAIYMPLVLCTVMALLYLALFNMQEYLLMYQVQRVCAVTAREEAYLGYEEFNMGSDNEIDFSWGEGGLPSSKMVKDYYIAHHNNASDLYREIGGVLSAVGASGGGRMDYSSRFNDVAQSSLITLGSISTPEIEVDTGFFGTGVTVTITHSLPMPGVLAYLDYQGNTTIRTAAYSYSINPGEFVRNVDLAADLMDYIMEKLGLSKSYNNFLSKTDEVLSVIL